MEFKMRKSIIISAALITTFSIASPLLMGLVAENQFTTQLDVLSKEKNLPLVITDIEYNRGYSQSNASFVMTFDDVSDEMPALSILYTTELQHVPVNMNEFGLSVFEIYSQDHITLSQGPDALISFINENMGGYVLTGYSRANVLGGFESVLSTAALNFNNEAGDLNIQVDSLVLNTSGKLDGSETEFDVQLPSSNIVGTDFSVKLESISAIGDRRTDASGVELGSTRMEVAQLSITSATGSGDIKEISLSGVSDLIDNKIDTNISYKIGSIEAPFPVSSASYNVDLNGLAVASAQLVQDLQQQIENMELDPESAAAYFDQLLSATLQPGLQINQELKANAFGGDWKVDLDVEYTGVEGIELSALADPKVAVKGIAATMVITADKDSILRTPAAPMLDGLLQQGLITLDNTNLTSVAKLSEGKLTVNDLEMPVEPLIDALLLKIAQSQQEEVAVN
jgi:uncharacterized protein YdgA (DUF945 family)